MKNTNSYTTLISLILILSILLPLAGKAQIVKREEVKKIVIRSNSMDRIDDTIETYEVKKTDSGWVSIRTGYLRQPTNTRSKEPHVVSLKHIFINKIDQKAIDELLDAANHAGAVSPSRSLGITLEYLKYNADTIFRKASTDADLLSEQELSQLDAKELSELKAGITEDKVDRAIKESIEFTSFAMDAGIDRDIDIVGNNKDTIKLNCSNFRNLMLPWVKNRRDTTYNIAISRFFADVTGSRFFKNNKSLIDEDFYLEIYSSVYRDYFMFDFNYEFFKKHYPRWYDKLTANYAISRIRVDRRPGNHHAKMRVDLHPLNLPGNVVIEANLDLTNMLELDTLSVYKHIIDSLFNEKNFVFEHVAASPGCQLVFSYHGYGLVGYQSKQKKYPYLQKYPWNTIIDFYVVEQAKQFQMSSWYFLPDSSMLLKFFRGGSSIDFIRQNHLITIPNTDSYNDVCVVFDSKGEMIQNFTP